jgi:endogenous inhibitor of DNA gyrase (YacG/DUF329 family)
MPDVPIVKCPHCGQPVPWTDTAAYKPFCSERCRLIDLGDWLLEKNALPADEPLPDQGSSDS